MNTTVKTARGNVAYTTRDSIFDGVEIVRVMQCNGAVHSLLIDDDALEFVENACREARLAREARKP